MNSRHDWPRDIEYVRDWGEEGYSTPGLIRRWVAVFETFVADPALSRYGSILVVEYDSVFLKPAPAVPEGFFTHLAGGNIGGFKAERFYHCPWGASRQGAEAIVAEGRKLMADGDFEGGSPDFFMGLIIQNRPEVLLHETGTFSVNGGNLPERKPEAIEALNKGTWFLHGLRTKDELEWILQESR